MRTFLALTLLSPIAIAACGDDPPPTPAETRSRISSDLGNVLHASNAALAGGDTVPSASSLAVIDQLLGTQTSGDVPATGSFEVDADASVTWLNDQLFTDANHVGNGIYQIPSSLVCKRTTTDAAGNSTTAVDPDCVAKADQLALRVRTAVDGDTLTFALQVDADHDEPLQLALGHASVALTVDFDELQHAEAAIAAVLGSGSNGSGNAASTVTLSGRITGKLAVLGPAKIQASLAIDRALSLAAGAGADGLLLTSAAASGVAITLDGTAKAGSVTAALGKTVFRLPKIGDQQTELDLAGLSATGTFAAGQPLQLTHLGLGDASTTVSVNGQRAETLDLNPDDGRAVDVKVTRDDTAGTTTVAFAPKLDVHVAVDHTVLGDTAKLFDVTRVQLDGSVTGHDAGDQVQITTGTLAITTNPASYGITATAGQCVSRTDTQWTVGACP